MGSAMTIAIIVALAENRVIGRDGGLPWHIPDDLRHFKTLTMNKPIIMGRRTYQAIGRALPGRTNIVISRSEDFDKKGIRVARNFLQAVGIAREVARDGEIMVIGGAEIYRMAFDATDKIYLTEIHDKPEGDTYFPRLDRSEWRELDRQDQEAVDGLPSYSFVTLERAKK